MIAVSDTGGEKFSGHRDRPDVLTSETHRIETGYGYVYVCIGRDDDADPFEVFINTGDSGGYTNAWAEALAKTISNALRSGTDPEVIADDLMGVRMDKVADDNGDTIMSIPDAVGVAMKRSIQGKQGEKVRGE